MLKLIASLINLLGYEKFNTNSVKVDIEEELRDTDKMEGHDFEHWCANLISLIGFQDVYVTRGSGDQGADIIAVRGIRRYAFQCKCHGPGINEGNDAVKDILLGKSFYKCNVAVAITNQYFTKHGIEAAKSSRVRLWNRDIIKRMLRQCALQYGNLYELSANLTHWDTDPCPEKWRKSLWPTNEDSCEIDFSYYADLPSVKKIQYREYVKMYVSGHEKREIPYILNSLSPNEKIDLFSDRFIDKEDAEHFAKAIQKNRYAMSTVEMKIARDGYVVKARMILSVILKDYRHSMNCFVFPNWA